MLTLDEAVAWLDKMLELHVKPCGEPDCGECLRDTRAAVRDVALAVWYATVARASNSLSMAAVAENIDRLFPKEDLPHG
jgi:hypothetical protein